jgi:hypothetical protein
MKRSMQAYLAANEPVDELFSDAHLSWRDAEQMRIVLDVVMEGLSPSNNPLISPLGWKAMIDTGGLSLLRGVRHFLSDMASAPRVPSMIEPDAFTVGKTVAATPGEIVYRSEVFELIQYTPQTEKVYTVPLLLVPPVINKYYIMDIAPGRSMIEYFARQGHQSSRSPGAIPPPSTGRGASTPTAPRSSTRSAKSRRSPNLTPSTCRTPAQAGSARR